MATRQPTLNPELVVVAAGLVTLTASPGLRVVPTC